MKISIIVKGGLGNQLFIYAFYRSYLTALYSSIIIDTDSFNTDSYSRDFLLNKLFSSHPASSTVLVRRPLLDKIRIKLSRILLPSVINNFFRFIFLRYFRVISDENISTFDNRFTGTLIFNGYWQDQQYAQLLDDLAIHQIADCLELQLSTPYHREVETIALHLREKDYDYPLSLSYYIKSIKYLASRLSIFRVLIFSESNSPTLYDISNYLTTSEVDFDIAPVGSALEDFRKMSQCDHFIIARSTYSWWSAYLKSRILSNTIVIMPKRLGFITDDKLLTPDHWIKF